MVGRNKRPLTINASWKVDQEKIISVAFGASISAHQNTKEGITLFRQRINRYLFPHVDVISKIEVWEFRNCAETNAWTSLCQFRTGLLIKTRTISIQSKRVMLLCDNCKACQDCLMLSGIIVDSMNSMNPNLNM